MKFLHFDAASIVKPLAEWSEHSLVDAKAVESALRVSALKNTPASAATRNELRRVVDLLYAGKIAAAAATLKVVEI